MLVEVRQNFTYGFEELFRVDGFGDIAIHTGRGHYYDPALSYVLQQAATSSSVIRKTRRAFRQGKARRCLPFQSL